MVKRNTVVRDGKNRSGPSMQTAKQIHAELDMPHSTNEYI